MTDSITPPRELMEQWASEKSYDERDWLYEFHIATRAAQWGADQELKACCAWMRNAPFGLSLNTSADQLRIARRPKPPSLKEQSIALLDLIQGNKDSWQLEDLDVVRRALEALPE